MWQIVAALILIIVYAFCKLRKYSRERNLYNLVSWSVEDKARESPSLRWYISNAQVALDLPQEYRIKEDDEWEFAEEILRKYQKDLAQSYFRGHLKALQSKYVIRGEDYFMFSLECFLSKHQRDIEFFGKRMRKESSSRISEFSVVYHKLFYITILFCINSKSICNIRTLKPLKNLTLLRAQSIKAILDTGELEPSA